MFKQKYGSWRKDHMEKAVFAYCHSDIGLNLFKIWNS